MTSKREAVLLCAATLLVAASSACRSGASRSAQGGDAAAASPRTPASASPSSASPPSPADATATQPPKVTTLEASTVEHAALQPNGHVLVTSPDGFFDWDPTAATVRRADLGADAAAETTFTRVQSGNTRFIVGKVKGARALALELWDAATLTKVRALDGRWQDGTDESNHSSSFSLDQRRFLFLGCGPLDDAGNSVDCTACVYTLPDGARERCTRMPALVQQGYVGRVELAPSGDFFVFDQYFMPTELRESSSGRVILRVKGSYQANLLGDGRHFMFVDNRRVVTSSNDAKTLRLMALPATRVVGSVDYSRSGASYELGHVRSPDRKRIATLLTVKDERKVGIWDIDANTSSTSAIPPSVCTSCALRWTRPNELVVYSSADARELELRIDVASGTATPHPFEPKPDYAMDGFEVFGDDPGGGATSALVTPTGRKRVLAGLDPRRQTFDVFEERLIASGPDRVTVVTKDGLASVLETRAPSRDR
ncbi:MAG: hypothetical protein KF795_03340 [Labilithrix sp.]|nr:hypothetical protein [Labilithrix sp.]